MSDIRNAIRSREPSLPRQIGCALHLPQGAGRSSPSGHHAGSQAGGHASRRALLRKLLLLAGTQVAHPVLRLRDTAWLLLLDHAAGSQVRGIAAHLPVCHGLHSST